MRKIRLAAGRLSFRQVLFHTNPLVPDVTKRKPSRFSAAKAVKANARERVGQPKPARAIEEKTKRTGREAKHKERLEELIQRDE